MRDVMNQDWPVFKDYPQSEAGWNDYANAWLARRRRVPLLNQIPISAIEEHRQAMQLGRDEGWREWESG